MPRYKVEKDNYSDQAGHLHDPRYEQRQLASRMMRTNDKVNQIATEKTEKYAKAEQAIALHPEAPNGGNGHQQGDHRYRQPVHLVLRGSRPDDGAITENAQNGQDDSHDDFGLAIRGAGGAAQAQRGAQHQQ